MQFINWSVVLFLDRATGKTLIGKVPSFTFVQEIETLLLRIVAVKPLHQLPNDFRVTEEWKTFADNIGRV